MVRVLQPTPFVVNAERESYPSMDRRPAEQFPYWREVVCASITRLSVARADVEAGLTHLTIKAPRPLLAPLLAQPAMRPPREPLLPTGLNALLVSYARSLMHAGPIDSARL